MTSTMSLAERTCSSVAGEKNPAMGRNKLRFQHRDLFYPVEADMAIRLFCSLKSVDLAFLEIPLFRLRRRTQHKAGVILESAAQQGFLENLMLHRTEARKESAAVHLHLVGFGTTKIRRRV